MKRSSPQRIQDIKESVAKIIASVENITEDEFYGNDVLYSAILRWLEIIGEASKYVDEHIKKQSPEIPWKRMAAMRDVTIHDYAELLQKRIWETIQHDIPLLKKELDKISTSE